MKKKKISESYVKKFWLELYDWDDIPREIRGLNLNNVDSINTIVKEFLSVKLSERSISTQYRTKESLRYAINFWDDLELENIYYSVMPVLQLPTSMSCREFYKHVWSFLFCGESYTIKDKSEYVDIGRVFVYY